jgi:DNA adenine methylase
MDKKVKPIIKWTGGKYREFTLFKDHIPAFERYIEPFFGGGGVFFALQPKTAAIINDKSSDLIKFYKHINNSEFKDKIYEYADAWEEMTGLCDELWEDCASVFTTFIKQEKDLMAFQEKFTTAIPIRISKYKAINSEDFMVDKLLFIRFLIESMSDKALRIRRICEKEKRIFNTPELKDHFHTGLKSGMYLFFRNLMNRAFHGDISISEPKSAANWYFVREFCYAAMFRYNAKGEFNIPYGGIAYNNKNFRQKADLIFEEATQKLFERTEIFNLDFEKLLNNLTLTPSDFIFLDPPYDSEFSEYDQNAFTKDDQKRLARFLINCVAKWMVVIKETKFIREIYSDSRVKMLTFGKHYTYNVRGRNERKVTHLIITNY